jgi:acyl-CoA dehydrogenase
MSDQQQENETDWLERADNIAADLRPEAAHADATGELPVKAYERLREAGLTSALVPTELGGGGASHTQMGQILRHLAHGDPAVAVTLSMHAHLVATQVWRHHQGLDASAVLRRVADGAFLISTGASDWIGSSGSVERVGGGYRVTGRKAPASGCEVGDVLVTSFRWDTSPDGPQVLHCSVPFDADGVGIEQTWDTLGLRATGSHTVVVDDVFVPDAAVALVRPADRWHPIWNTVLGAALPLIMAAYAGIADTALDVAVEAARAKVDAGAPPNAQAQLVGELVTAHTTAADVIDAMFASSDDLRFANTDQHASLTLARKTAAASGLIETVRLAIEVVGGAGFTRSSDLERLFRDVHGCLFHPLPRSRQLDLTGRVALGSEPV